MTRTTYLGLTELQRIGVLLLCGRAASAVLREYPPHTFATTECRWTAEAIERAGCDGDAADVGKVYGTLRAWREGNATRLSFIGGNWLLKAARSVGDELNADLRRLNDNGGFVGE